MSGREMGWRLLYLGCVLASVFAEAAVGSAPVAKRLLRAEGSWLRELARNGALNEVDADRFVGWRGYRGGYHVDKSQRHSGPASARCENQPGGSGGGIAQTVRFAEPSLAPIVVSAWSKAKDVSGTPDNNYSVYVDLLYADGTPLWGQAAAFSTGTHDWQRREVLIVPEKPVRQLTVYGLFRAHTGTVWFDDFSVRRLSAPRGAGMFDGVLVAAPARPAPDRSPLHGLLLVRDAAAESDIYLAGEPADGSGSVRIDELRLRVSYRRERIDEKTCRIDVELADLTGRDRAINLYYVVPVDAAGWRWWDNIQQWRGIERGQQYMNVVRSGVGATGSQSHYPFACISNGRHAYSLLVTEPRVCRFCYDGLQRELYVSFDLGLSPDTKRPGRATASLYAAETDPAWSMRATAQLYYRLLPQYFDKSRVPKRQGNWMAFTKISSVQDYEDFYFAVHEGTNDVAWDNEHGIMPFVYVEPMTFWMPMPPEDERSYAGAMARLERILSDRRQRHYARAWATKLSVLKDSAGRYRVQIRNAPWCDGAVFANNADPDVPEEDGHLNQGNLNLSQLRAAFKSAASAGGLAGIYLDSLEGWGFLTNWRREHWRAADLPLTYDTGSRKPVLLNIMSTYEFTVTVARWMHSEGKLLMANSVPHRFPWLANPLDLMGTETNWLTGSRFSPPLADYMYLKRTMAWHKPYMFLMNTNYDRFGPELVERYMQRCLFYGMFPGFFSENASTNPYFGNPRWYNRDRHLFKKYMPALKRVAEAGWEPLTLAWSDDAAVWVERFGRSIERGLFFTVMNTASERRRVRLLVEGELVGGTGWLIDLLDGSRFQLGPEGARVELAAEQVRAFRLQRPSQ